jgi:hypothetical protein
MGKDFQAFDQTLSNICEAFRTVGGSTYSEERWRWDIPAVTFTWSDSAGVQRNLIARLTGESTPQGIEVEGNVWQDVRERGETRRHWRHIPPQGRSPIPEEKELTELLREVHTAVGTTLPDPR